MQGKLHFSNNAQHPTEYVDINQIKKYCPDELTREKIYHAFDSIGLHYGDSFQVIEACWLGKQQALSKLRFNTRLDTFTLHPVILDGALQTAVQLLNSLDSNLSARLPFSIAKIDIFHADKIHSIEYVHIELMAQDRVQI